MSILLSNFNATLSLMEVMKCRLLNDKKDKTRGCCYVQTIPMAAMWHKIVLIWAAHIDVIVISIRVFEKLDLLKVWLAIGTDTHLIKYTPQQTQTSLRRLQDVWKKSWRLTTKPDALKTSGKRRLIYDVLKTSDLRCLEDAQFTTSWRRLIYDVRCLEDVEFTSS